MSSYSTRRKSGVSLDDVFIEWPTVKAFNALMSTSSLEHGKASTDAEAEAHEVVLLADILAPGGSAEGWSSTSLAKHAEIWDTWHLQPSAEDLATNRMLHDLVDEDFDAPETPRSRSSSPQHDRLRYAGLDHSVDESIDLMLNTAPAELIGSSLVEYIPGTGATLLTLCDHDGGSMTFIGHYADGTFATVTHEHVRRVTRMRFLSFDAPSTA